MNVGGKVKNSELPTWIIVSSGMCCHIIISHVKLVVSSYFVGIVPKQAVLVAFETDFAFAIILSIILISHVK